MRLSGAYFNGIIGVEVENMNRQKHSKGYWLVYQPDHPYRNKDGYIPEARLVMEKHLGRYVNPLIEDVHHKTKNKQNNKLENLILLTKSEHRRLHSGWIRRGDIWWKTCRGCGFLMPVEGNFYKRHAGHNEYVSMCKKCIRRISAASRPPKLSHEEHSTIASSAALKGWETRRQNKGGD
jgi:hypothetical protein